MWGFQQGSFTVKPSSFPFAKGSQQSHGHRAFYQLIDESPYPALRRQFISEFTVGVSCKMTQRIKAEFGLMPLPVSVDGDLCLVVNVLKPECQSGRRWA